jgi:hypothetical protein
VAPEPACTSTLYRVVQEWLGSVPNGASRLDVALAGDAADAILRLGTGPSWPAPEGDAYRAIPAALRARVRLAGGSLCVAGDAASGMSLAVRVPLHAAPSGCGPA